MSLNLAGPASFDQRFSVTFPSHFISCSASLPKMHEKDVEDSQHVDSNLRTSDSSLDVPVEGQVRLKKVIRQVDIRLSAILALMYCVNQIDRTNLPMA